MDIPPPSPEAGLIIEGKREGHLVTLPSPRLGARRGVAGVTESQAGRNLEISLLVSICFADEEIPRWEGPFLWLQR